ncbi:MAG: ABC transporter transmembrane domain-containing protein [Bacteroidota bacterium]
MNRTRNTNGESSKRKLDKQGLKKLLGIYQYMIPYRHYFVLGMIALFFSSLITLSLPKFAGTLLKTAMDEQESTLPWLQDIQMIALLGFGVFILQGAFSFLRIWLFAKVNEPAMADIRQELYENLLGLSLTFFDKNRVGSLISRVTADVSTLQSAFSTTLAELFRQIITLVVGITLLFFVNVKLTLFMLGVVPVVVIGMMFFGRRIRKISRHTQDMLAETNTIVDETLQAISVVKAFTNELFEVGRYRKGQNEVVSAALKASVYRAGFAAFIVVAFFSSVIAVFWYGASLVEGGQLKAAELVEFVLYTVFIAGSIAGLGTIYTQVQSAIGASERVLEIISEKGELQLSSANAPIERRVSGEISFENVRFSYPTRPEIEVIQGLNLNIRAGEKIALVGSSGAGKSTIIQLLLRFYPLNGGKICVDGKNVADSELLDYRSHLGMVPQEVILFGGTIRENIAYGNPEASEEKIREAAQQANALRFIESFPEGLDTLVGERAEKLSGGQRQRIAIARAILKDPEILILDEATSSLDAESEHLVQEALEKLMKNRTTIVIAHRLATIRKVDTIYVLEQGQIIESGTHESLLTEGGTYSQLVKLQMMEV